MITWLDSANECDHVVAAENILSKFCNRIEREYWIPRTNYRCDLKGVLSNGHYALVECKPLRHNMTPFVDAVMQAASYADKIKYPVFIGPVFANPMDIAAGRHDNAIGALHLIGGRLNVGFLGRSRYGRPFLLLRGQVIVDENGPTSKFDHLWGYVQRRGSQQTKA